MNKWMFDHKDGLTSNGIAYRAELWNINGVKVFLMPCRGTKQEEISKAKKEMRRQRDVVGFEVIKVPVEYYTGKKVKKTKKAKEFIWCYNI